MIVIIAISITNKVIIIAIQATMTPVVLRQTLCPAHKTTDQQRYNKIAKTRHGSDVQSTNVALIEHLVGSLNTHTGRCFTTRAGLDHPSVQIG